MRREEVTPSGKVRRGLVGKKDEVQGLRKRRTKWDLRWGETLGKSVRLCVKSDDGMMGREYVEEVKQQQGKRA